MIHCPFVLYESQQWQGEMSMVSTGSTYFLRKYFMNVKCALCAFGLIKALTHTHKVMLERTWCNVQGFSSPHKTLFCCIVPRNWVLAWHCIGSNSSIFPPTHLIASNGKHFGHIWHVLFLKLTFCTKAVLSKPYSLVVFLYFHNRFSINFSLCYSCWGMFIMVRTVSALPILPHPPTGLLYPPSQVFMRTALSAT